MKKKGRRLCLREPSCLNLSSNKSWTSVSGMKHKGDNLPVNSKSHRPLPQILSAHSAEAAPSYLLYPFLILVQPFHSYRRLIPVLQVFPLDRLPIPSPPSSTLYHTPSPPHTPAERKSIEPLLLIFFRTCLPRLSSLFYEQPMSLHLKIRAPETRL